MKKPAIRFKFTRNNVVAAANLPDYLLDLGFKNGDKFKVSCGQVIPWDTPYYYISKGALRIKIQSTDGILTGYSNYFEVVE
jgi:hypothetical protein